MKAGANGSAPGKLAEQVYEALKEQIHDFKLVAGDRFSEAELGARLGMSRTPVREALFRLRNEGFLGVESKLGWHVLPIDFGRLEQLYDLRVVLELASIARLCARADTPLELEALKAVWLVPPGERLADPRSVGAHDEQFHAALVRAAGNDEMARVHWDVTERIRIIRRLDFTRANRIEATYVEHAKILRAVMQKKADQAQLLLKTHIEQSKAEVRKITLHTLQAARERAAR
jgi:DNA-binding GntR family transcriptional regulator